MNPSVPGKSRYELREVLGRGGMGVVYRAYDTLMRREVALKTLLDVESQAAKDLFYREWGTQAGITHPNIAEIYDIGEMAVEGELRPYFVMPLLSGCTLADLIRTSSERLTVERAANLIAQVARGLQAAHDRGLIHRDLKPSNVYVLEDDSVKIIDFGIAHVEAKTQTSIRGTLSYMAPELLQMKPATTASDIYALGVVAYETLTGRRPFQGGSDAELTHAILNEMPPNAADLNHAIPLNLARAVHKALAKQPWHRFATAREFGETVLKACRGEALALFDPAKIQPRIERASRAFERGEYDVATEILNELESEGCAEQDITMLRRQVEQARRRIVVQQLLESARRFMQEEEFPLALRKVQEALDLDPGNRDVQALKNDLEKQRRARKIEEWAQLAKSHLDNNAFAHARSALQSLLELRPGEPNALALLAEIDRRERDFEGLRVEKNKLVQDARQAWQRGEVTAALTNLEKWMSLDQQAPDTDAERVGTLQKFYNQVRGEQDAIKSSYERARQLLADGDFVESLAICRQYLAKYPGHALFQALQFDVEERQRQNLSALIAETDRRVEAEPDLDRRVAILQAAAEQHPDESHFQRALKLARDKRDLVSGVVSRARLNEDEQRFVEALEQWQLLRTIHPAFPGLDYEIDRVRARREKQARGESRAQWVSKIDKALEANQLDRAASAAGQALAEFPGDAELEELSKMVDQRRASHAEALSLLAQAQAKAAEGNPDDGLDLLRKAHALESQNPTVRVAYVDALAARARELAETDADAATRLLNEILSIDPGHTLAINIRALRADKEREEFVSWCTAQARKLQASGDVEGAIVIVQQGLGRFPNDVRLNQLHSTLQRASDVTSTRTAPVPAPAAPAPPQATPVTPVTPAPQTPRTPQTPPPPAHRPATPQTPLNAPSPPPAPPEAPAATPRVATPPPPPPTPPPAPSPAHGKPRIPPLSAPRSVSRSARWILLGGAAFIILASVVTLWLRNRDSAAAGVEIEIRTTPPGARILIDREQKGLSNLTLSLPPGQYQATAELEGYEPATVTLNVVKNKPAALDLTLQVFKPVVRVWSEVQLTQAILDNRDMTPGAPGEFMLDQLGDGNMELRLLADKSETKIPLTVAVRSQPSLAAPPASADAIAVVVCAYADRAIVYSTLSNARAGIDGQPARAVPLEGASFQGVAPGTHSLAFDDGAAVRNLTLQTTGGPAVLAFLLARSDAGKGSILVAAGEDNVSVKINNYAHHLRTVKGVTRLLGLNPGVYRIAVSKDGFEATPPQDVEVKAGQETTVRFQMKALVRMATLRLRSAAGTQVYVDNLLSGAVAPDGAFTTQVPPGEHAIELRRGTAKSRVVTHNFQPGETFDAPEDQLALQQPNGTIRIDVTPPQATLTFRRAGEPESGARPMNNPASLPPGEYVITASSPGYASTVITLQVTPGSSQEMPVLLRQVAAAKQAAGGAGQPLGMADFDEPGAWISDGGWMIRRGGKFVTYKPARTAGVFSFMIQLRKGKRLQWVLGFTDSRNYALFRVERNQLTRYSVINGRTRELAKAALPAASEFRITVSPDKIVHEVRAGAQWAVVDEWVDPGRDHTNGKFGFLIDEGVFGQKDEYAVRNFSFRPSR